MPGKWNLLDIFGMNNLKIILDTNLWISFLITKNYQQLDQYILDGKLKLIFSNELIEEFISVTARSKFKKYFSNTDVDELIQLFDFYGEHVKVTSDVNKCRDPKDNFLLNLAIDSKADYLVTGDSDLLVIRFINTTKIITLKSLLDH